MSLTYNELINNVLGWSAKTNILGAGFIDGQYIKITEETGELAGWIARKNTPMIKDTVGDILVILTNLTKMFGEDPEKICINELKYIDTHPKMFKLDNINIGRLLSQLSRVLITFGENLNEEGTGVTYQYPSVHYNNVWSTVLSILTEISGRHGFTPLEALNDAWDIIKDREGIFYNKVFIKSEDFTLDLLTEILNSPGLSDEAFTLAKKHAALLVG